MNSENENPIRVMGLHSITYCERLYYLEEVEGILLQDERVFEGRTLHEEIKVDNDEIGRVETFEYTSAILGLTGKADRLQKRDGMWIPYEHKKGRSKTDGKEKAAWEPDIIQVMGYVLLVEEESGRKIEEARIRYHRDNVLVKIKVTDELREKTVRTIERAKELSISAKRPDVAWNPNLCIRCSLAPVCLPEENRVITEDHYESIRLFPPNREKQTIHITGYQTFLHKSGETLEVEKKNYDGTAEKIKVPFNEIESLIVHGTCQLSTQLIIFLTVNEIPIHYFSGGGNFVGSINSNSGNVQRKIRQYEALADEKFRLYLTKKLALAKCEAQFRYLLRASRKEKRSEEQQKEIDKIKSLLSEIDRAENIDSVRGYEGMTAKLYHQLIPSFLIREIPSEMIPNGRTKRPPKDRYNAALSFLYALLYKSVLQAVISVGLDPAFGFFHTARSQANPLVLDLMELFRTSVCDIALIGSVNRNSWDITNDFEVTKEKVWLSDSGRKKAIKVYEERLNDTWKHPVMNYSLSYYRMMELEVRLLEKEWSDQAGLFAKARLR